MRIVDDQHKLILRLFSRAAARVGSVAHLALRLHISQADAGMYLQGKAIPPEEVLLGAVDIILDELPNIRREFPPEVWRSLSLPKT